MTYLVASVGLSNTYDFWRQRTNDLALAANNFALTVVGGNSRPTTGNAALNGRFQANVISVPTSIAGGTTGNPTTLFTASAFAVPNNLVIGSSFDFFTAADNTTSSPAGQVLGTTSNTSSFVITNYSTSSVGSTLVGAKSRAATIGSRTIVANNDTIFNIIAEADNSSTYNQTASIKFIVDATPSGGVIPARITFNTANTSTAVPAERVRINNLGYVGIAQTSPAYPLDIVGDINFTGVLRNNGNFFSGGAKGNYAMQNQVFYENDQEVTGDYSITSGKNAMSAGPVNINSGITVTIPAGSRWVIV